jgi:hypothetical protein
VLHALAVTVLVSRLTCPPSAAIVPTFEAPVRRLTLAVAMIVPAKDAAVLRVAEDPTSQKTPQAEPLLMNETEAAVATVRVVPIWKIQTGLSSLRPSRTSGPVSPTDEPKQ